MTLSKENAQELNADFLRLIEAQFPQWLAHVRAFHDKDANQDFLELTIPDASGVGNEHPLEISTWGQEITVSFGDFHIHFPWSEEYIEAAESNRVVNYLQAILDENIIIASVWAEGRMKLSSTILSNELTKFTDVPPGDHELRIASWRGTYDRRLPVDWQSYLKASHS
ncbi:hypothetical protein AB4Y85_09370 [Microvirga sp. 2YAF29]|uniref:hypothetical protein n=1 Tax=Microvirga sp. 2YAF29 TaxID=3233031 RepID=UPI003F9AAC4A